MDEPTFEESVMGPVEIPAVLLITLPTRILSVPEATVVIRLAPETLDTVYVQKGPGASYGTVVSS